MRSVMREPGLVSWCAQRCAGAALWAYLRAYHGLRVEGGEWLPASPPFVIVANHASHLDALVIAAALPRRLRSRVYPLSAGDAFYESLALSAVTSVFLNGLPLWRKRAAGRALEELRARLTAGECGLILFPEGARTRSGEMGAFKAGVGRLVAGTGVPVVPCWIRGAYRALPPGGRVPRPARVVLRVGGAMTFEGVRDDRAGWEEVARELRGSVEGLGGEGEGRA